MPDDRFAVFLDIFGHPRSASAPIMGVGSAYQGVLSVFAANWQAGQVADLADGLRAVDRDIDAHVAQATRERRTSQRIAAA